MLAVLLRTFPALISSSKLFLLFISFLGAGALSEGRVVEVVCDTGSPEGGGGGPGGGGGGGPGAPEGGGGGPPE